MIEEIIEIVLFCLITYALGFYHGYTFCKWR